MGQSMAIAGIGFVQDATSPVHIAVLFAIGLACAAVVEIAERLVEFAARRSRRRHGRRAVTDGVAGVSTHTVREKGKPWDI